MPEALTAGVPAAVPVAPGAGLAGPPAAVADPPAADGPDPGAAGGELGASWAQSAMTTVLPPSSALPPMPPMSTK